MKKKDQKRVPGLVNSKCKGPVVGMSLAHLGNRKEPSALRMKRVVGWRVDRSATGKTDRSQSF